MRFSFEVLFSYVTHISYKFGTSIIPLWKQLKTFHVSVKNRFLRNWKKEKFSFRTASADVHVRIIVRYEICFWKPLMHINNFVLEKYAEMQHADMSPWNEKCDWIFGVIWCQFFGTRTFQSLIFDDPLRKNHINERIYQLFDFHLNWKLLLCSSMLNF